MYVRLLLEEDNNKYKMKANVLRMFNQRDSLNSIKK